MKLNAADMGDDIKSADKVLFQFGNSISFIFAYQTTGEIMWWIKSIIFWRSFLLSSAFTYVIAMTLHLWTHVPFSKIPKIDKKNIFEKINEWSRRPSKSRPFNFIVYNFQKTVIKNQFKHVKNLYPDSV